jgi:hypothetical protein
MNLFIFWMNANSMLVSPSSASRAVRICLIGIACEWVMIGRPANGILVGESSVSDLTRHGRRRIPGNENLLASPENPLPFYPVPLSSSSEVDLLNIGEKNVGMMDRVLRIIAGIVLLGVFALGVVAAPWSYLVALIGLIALVTGAIGTCALYSLIGMNTVGK